MTDEAATAAAIAAGWNPDDGPAPFAHSPFVAPLAESLDLDDLLNEDGTIKVPT